MNKGSGSDNGGAAIDWSSWLDTPAGQYVLDWEQKQIDVAVADIFGFHAVQLGFPELQGLRANRMPHRWQVNDTPHPRVVVQCDFDALPFDSQSLDLVVLPHTLERAADPHDALREVDRVLMPEGRVVITGFNPASLWGVRDKLGRLRQRLALGTSPSFLPAHAELITQGRLRDWLHLLNLEVELGRFGCYGPPLQTDQWPSHFEWMEPAGDRWWPMFGAVYVLVAVKRVRGLRLVGLAKRAKVRRKAASAMIAQRRPSTPSTKTFHE